MGRSRHDVSLNRGLGLLDVTMIGVGAMIGAGIFALTGIAAGEAGPVGLLLAFLLNGVVTSLTGLTYAELGAAIPEAGGGYLWVRESLSRFWGFFAGWISWFSHSVACSLYAVIFGTFFVELLKLAGYEFSTQPSWLGISPQDWAIRIVTVLVILLFLWINFRGASETGSVGNVITIFKIIVLLALVFFGVKAMINMPNWADNFLRDPSPLPRGIMGVVMAMGLTFVAFEGYEIIAQSGEELIDPGRNLPRAIFYSIAIVVFIYLAVAFVSIGAMVQNSGLPNWLYLGQEGERAMIRIAGNIMPYGTLLMILGGLASTTSALNATVYSSSRVSFAMGRGGDLPRVFGRIHRRNRTPHVAIALSGLLIVVMALALPVEDVASGASLTFLVLFLLTNISLLRLRKTHPDLDRPFKVPWVPTLPILAIVSQGVLAVGLLKLSPIAWGSSIAWTVLGIWVYQRWGGREEAEREADTILLEETIAPRGFSVLLPVDNAPEAREGARLASMIARYYDGEVFAMHAVRVPPSLGLSDGRALLKQGRPVLEEVIAVGKDSGVPVRTQLRLGRDVAQSIINAATERKTDLIVLTWAGNPGSADASYGHIIDEVSSRPPCDLAVLRVVRHVDQVRRILVPVAGGPNTALALEIATAMAEVAKEAGVEDIEVVALHLLPPEADPKEIAERQRDLLENIMSGWPIELRVMAGESGDVVEDILKYAEHFDHIVIGASEEGLLERAIFGSIPQRLAEEANRNVVIVKKHHLIKHGLLGRLFGLRRKMDGNH